MWSVTPVYDPTERAVEVAADEGEGGEGAKTTQISSSAGSALPRGRRNVQGESSCYTTAMPRGTKPSAICHGGGVSTLHSLRAAALWQVLGGGGEVAPLAGCGVRQPGH